MYLYPELRMPVERLWRIVAKKALLASGAEERPLVFGGNDISRRDDGSRHAHLSQPIWRGARRAGGDLHRQ